MNSITTPIITTLTNITTPIITINDECPVCLDIIYDEIKLSCSHPLCKNCYQKIINHNYIMSNVSFLCPICRHKQETITIQNPITIQTISIESTNQTNIPVIRNPIIQQLPLIRLSFKYILFIYYVIIISIISFIIYLSFY